MTTEIRYVLGNALEPIPVDPMARIVIPHICNNVGAFGAGFALAVANKYPKAKVDYHWMGALYSRDQFLGKVGFVGLGNGITIANMVAQDGLPTATRRTCIDYAALLDCLYQVAGYCDDYFGTCEVHAPRFGTGFAGGKWDRIESIIKQTLIPLRIPVIIYDLP